jgi:hypothetical protein
MSFCNRYVVGRERNVVHVDFGRKPDPPAPQFPGAAALRRTAWHFRRARPERIRVLPSKCEATGHYFQARARPP